MTAFLQAWDLWDVVCEEVEVAPLPKNPTVQQIKAHQGGTSKKFKAKTCLHSAVSESVFIRIMNLETAFKIWEYLKAEFQGNERTQKMRVLNLKREFESQRMKDSETVKEYADRLMEVVNKLRLFGEDMKDNRIVEKLLVTLPERFEAKISALEEVKDLTEISLADLLNALEAHEQRKNLREGDVTEGAMQANVWTHNQGNDEKDAVSNGRKNNNEAGFPPCQYCGKNNHPYYKCWNKPDAKCNKCNQMGHVERICKNKGKQMANEAQAVDQENLEQLF